ncbi:DEAD/DEAH box helicase [Lentibacillus sp. L22]|uniref:SNF2 helicase associated domain-containing protein n=1 Tax=Lentibacillus sp. L22 TaxID=3163028 RepID=UPI00346567FA
MDIALTQDEIMKLCGTASFKKGNDFYHKQQVTFEHISSDHCEATVIGKEDFHVTIESDPSGEFGVRTACSCPKLTSVKNECQHVAAVLLAMADQQHPTTIDSKIDPALAQGLLNLFRQERRYTSRYQPHFETRQLLEVVFLCKPVVVDETKHMLGIELMIGSNQVRHIRDFLGHVKTGTSYIISADFTYEPSEHCFQGETDDVIQQLIQVTDDEKVYDPAVANQSNHAIGSHTLIIPPSLLEKLVPLLSIAPFVKLMDDGKIVDGLPITNDTLPLQFVFSDGGSGDYQLNIQGIDQIKLMDDYQMVLYAGKLIRLDGEKSKRLAELKQMLATSSHRQIRIPKQNMQYFLEKVIPGLKELGDVTLPLSISQQLLKTPLVAKLYLDRVHNRLLAGLEFHYEGVVINPMQTENQPTTLIRDVAKEDAILQFMRDSEFTQTESGYYVHNEALEYEFLYHRLPELEQLVKVYATTAVRNRVLKEKAHPRIRVRMKRERINWLEFTFDMDGIPDKEMKQILKALEEKRKYYRLNSGSLLSLETREFEEIQRFLHTEPAQDVDLEDGLNVPVLEGFRLLDVTNDTEVFQFEQSFRQFWADIQQPDKLAFDVPAILEPILHEYQKHGFRWMKTLASHGFGGILADDMGLGKTLQSIAFILSHLTDIRKQKQPALIVCPSALTYNWLSEITRFAPDIKAVVVDGNQAARIALQKDAMDKDVVITSYPLLRMDSRWYAKQTFHTVFFDEAQAFKNPVTQTARAVKKINANHHFALTGTPIENSLEELWSIFHVVFPELFQGLKDYSNLPRKKIIRRIRPFLLRRTKADVLPALPEKVNSQESADLLPEQKKLYAAYLAKLRHDTLKHLDKDTFRKNRIRILAGLTRLRQICCHPALFVDGYQGSSAKFEQLLEILEESRVSGRRVLIFSQFTEMLRLIGRELAVRGMSFFYLDGHTPSEERISRCDRFNAGERNLFLISLKAGGTGLNLTGADTVILYDNWWNPAVEEQAADRAHRIGQTNAVQVIKLVARGTIEEKMNALQEKKRHLVEEVIDAQEALTQTLTEEDIRDILMI